MKMLGIICLMFGFIGVCVLFDDLSKQIYNWRLINLVTVPANIFIGFKLLLD